MRCKVFYVCDYPECGAQFETDEEAEKHEATVHYHLTMHEYFEWKALYHIYSEEADEYSEAELLKFEKEHDLHRRPSHWGT